MGWVGLPLMSLSYPSSRPKMIPISVANGSWRTSRNGEAEEGNVGDLESNVLERHGKNKR